METLYEYVKGEQATSDDVVKKPKMGIIITTDSLIDRDLAERIKDNKILDMKGSGSVTITHEQVWDKNKKYRVAYKPMEKPYTNR